MDDLPVHRGLNQQEMGQMKFYKQVELQKMFGIGSTYCTRICRAIDAHPEIYSEWSRNGTRYEICSFVHASKYLNELESDNPVPAFEPESIERVLSEHECKEERRLAESELKLDLIDRINEWFRVTEIPKDIKAEKYATIVRNAMIAIVSEETT